MTLNADIFTTSVEMKLITNATPDKKEQQHEY